MTTNKITDDNGEKRVMTAENLKAELESLQRLTAKIMPELDKDPIITGLQDELARVREANLDLKRQIKATAVQAERTPDDFATAISNSVDVLQVKLNQMKNPVCNFAIRGFELEVNVHVEVTPLGTVNYRFIDPSDEIDAAKLSKLKLNLVPLPKEDNVGSWTNPDFTPHVGLEEIQGIGDTYAAKLAEHQIYTVSDLLNVSTRVRSKAELAAMLDVSHQRLGEWISHAELLTIKSVDGRNAEVLSDIGAGDLATLAQHEPEALVSAYNARVAALGRDSLKPIAIDQAKAWTTAAKAFSGVKAKGPASTAKHS